MLYEVILDIGETPNKCTIAPLAGRSDFKLIRVKGEAALGPLVSPLLLHHQGACLTTLTALSRKTGGIASVDCVWRRLDYLLGRIAGQIPVLAKIPEGFLTAYPRFSRHTPDPDGGLATIEAIFVASALLGRWDVSLLSEYYFGRKFVALNRQRFLDLGVSQAADAGELPPLVPRQRTSQQRRRDRGKY